MKKRLLISGIIITLLIIYGSYLLLSGNKTNISKVESSRFNKIQGDAVEATLGKGNLEEDEVGGGVEDEEVVGVITENVLGKVPMGGDSTFHKTSLEDDKSEDGNISGDDNISGTDRDQPASALSDNHLDQEGTGSIEVIEEPVQRVPLLDKVKDHVVRKGDTLWDIARSYDIDIDTIIGANDINNMNRIKVGDVLRILPVKGIVYKIGPGESLWTIAKQFDISINSIVEANLIKDPDLVQPGTILILPGARPELGYQERLQKKFIKPVHARISSHFGGRWGRMHEGIDYAVNIGTPIKAASSGKVIYSGWARGYGKTIIIEHRKGLRTLYAHNSTLLVKSGDWVRRGEVISKSGNTGKSTGPHLHFEIQINGKPVNPLSYLR